ncbi:hypothetical protein, partial [Desulfonauticus submarinus]
MDKDLFKDSEFYFDESELASIFGIRDLLSKLGKPFQMAANNILTGIYTDFDPVIFIGMDPSIPIHNKTFNQLIRAIINKKLITFEYTVYSTFQVSL